MPVLGMNVGQGPFHVAPIEPASNMRVVDDIERVIVIDELVAEGLAEHRPGDGNKTGANCKL